MNMSESHGKIYYSKRDSWIVAVLWSAVVGMLIAAWQIGLSPTPKGLRVGMSALLLASAGLILWLLYSTLYKLTAQELVVRSGPFRWKVRLDSIQEISPTHNPLSSPACSLDRLRIRYRESRFGIMISPADKAAFLQDILSRSPGLKIDGERVIRAQ